MGFVNWNATFYFTGFGSDSTVVNFSLKVLECLSQQLIYPADHF